MDDICGVIKGEKLPIEPNSPSGGVTVVFIKNNDAPVEFIQVKLFSMYNDNFY